jgi:hypothetical protein
LKPSALDDCGSDADVEIEESVPYGAESEVSGIMVDMMVGLNDCDAQDMDWLPPREQRKLNARKRGTISAASRLRFQDYLPVHREKKDPLPWARYRCEIRTNSATPPTH